MPPKLRKYPDDDFWNNYAGLVEKYEPEEKNSEAALRDLVNPMRVRAGRNSKRFAALLSFLNGIKKEKFLDPAMLQTIRKLVKDFEVYLQDVKPLDQVPADKVLTAALNGLVLHEVLSQAEARTFCFTVLKKAVAKQWPSYSADELKVVLEQIDVLIQSDPESPILKLLQPVLKERLKKQLNKRLDVINK